jgi:hypothetical protein
MEGGSCLGTDDKSELLGSSSSLLLVELSLFEAENLHDADGDDDDDVRMDLAVAAFVDHSCGDRS